MRKPNQVPRREFIRNAAIAGASAALFPAGALAENLVAAAAVPSMMPQRPLGQTGQQVGLFSLGGQGLLEQGIENMDKALAIINRAIDLGVNYCDTSHWYGDGTSEKFYGQVMKTRRKEVYLCFYVFGLGAWLAIQQTFKQDVARGRVATVVGLVGFAETFVSAFAVEKVGAIVQHTGGFNAVFILFAGLFTGAALMVSVFMRERWFPSQKTVPIS